MENNNVKDYPPYLDYPKPRKPTTNADRIRAMSDEELAQWLVLAEQRILEMQPALERPALYKDWLDWLKQEATDG